MINEVKASAVRDLLIRSLSTFQVIFKGILRLSNESAQKKEDAMQKLQYDLYYVKNYSLFLDLLILLQTAEVVLWGRGAR